MREASTYLVIRLKDIFLYPEYFRMVSDARNAKADAQRLYGKAGHHLRLIPWSQATAQQKKDWAEHEAER